jgi:hypothetical protein
VIFINFIYSTKCLVFILWSEWLLQVEQTADRLRIWSTNNDLKTDVIENVSDSNHIWIVCLFYTYLMSTCVSTKYFSLYKVVDWKSWEILRPWPMPLQLRTWVAILHDQIMFTYKLSKSDSLMEKFMSIYISKC